MAERSTRGLWFEDYDEGLTFESPARTITEADVVAFAGLSGDYNPLHTDAEYAAGTPFGQRIAHGLLGLAVASGLAARTGLTEGTVLAFSGLSHKFRAPILIGDTVRLKARVSRLRAMPSVGGGMVVLAVSLVNQRDEVAQEGEWSLLIASRPEGAA